LQLAKTHGKLVCSHTSATKQLQIKMHQSFSGFFGCRIKMKIMVPKWEGVLEKLDCTWPSLEV
jgi:hypothetical protein